MNTGTAGYSGTPLAKKLGIKAAQRIVMVEAPKDYKNLLDPLPPGVVFARHVDTKVDLVHLFVTEKAELLRQLDILRKQLKPDAGLWVSWPKKAAKIPTTVSEDVIREVALPLGFVDIKVCAVNDTWSGLKLVVRKTLR